MLIHLEVGIYFPEIRDESDEDGMASPIHCSGEGTCLKVRWQTFLIEKNLHTHLPHKLKSSH